MNIDPVDAGHAHSLNTEIARLRAKNEQLDIELSILSDAYTALEELCIALTQERDSLRAVLAKSDADEVGCWD